jgi:hypothetical protein
MNHTFTEKYLYRAMTESTMLRANMIYEANGETLESEAEDAFRRFLTEMQQRVKMLDEKKITTTLRDVFLAGYRAAEEGRFR